jgi:hypothetical protein
MMHRCFERVVLNRDLRGERCAGMGLSITKLFLMEANRAAGGTDYFRWRTVAGALGCSEADARGAMQSLDERGLAILLADGEARMLPPGRVLAINLESKRGGAADVPARRGRR